MAYMLQSSLLFLVLSLALPFGKFEDGGLNKEVFSDPHIEIIEKSSISLPANPENSSKLSQPIKNYHQERFLRGKSIKNSVQDMLLSPQDDGSNYVNHWAALRSEGQFYGAQGTLNVYSLPNVQANQSSSTLIWLASGLNGPVNEQNFITAGWKVKPTSYGDNDPHLAIHWTVDGGQSTGCYDLQCEGFIPYPKSKYIPGSKIWPVSTYDGEQYEITLKISKDSQTGDWWLYAGRDANIPVGHWPKSLFTGLADNASIAQWGGVVAFNMNEKGPPMGSGHFPNEGARRAAYLKNIKVVSPNGDISDPHLLRFEDKTECYQMSGHVPYYFGGPGGCTN